jgi:hypothetical protein
MLIPTKIKEEEIRRRDFHIQSEETTGHPFIWVRVTMLQLQEDAAA